MLQQSFNRLRPMPSCRDTRRVRLPAVVSVATVWIHVRALALVSPANGPVTRLPHARGRGYCRREDPRPSAPPTLALPDATEEPHHISAAPSALPTDLRHRARRAAAHPRVRQHQDRGTALAAWPGFTELLWGGRWSVCGWRWRGRCGRGELLAQAHRRKVAEPACPSLESHHAHAMRMRLHDRGRHRGPQAPINLTLNEDLICGPTLPQPVATLPSRLLARHVQARVPEQVPRQRWADDQCAADWNVLHDQVGSFADEHSTL